MAAVKETDFSSWAYRGEIPDSLKIEDYVKPLMEYQFEVCKSNSEFYASVKAYFYEVCDAMIKVEKIGFYGAVARELSYIVRRLCARISECIVCEFFEGVVSVLNGELLSRYIADGLQTICERFCVND